MSVIFVFVGQCGNQVGAAVAKKLAENCATAPPVSFRNSNNNQQRPPLQQPVPYSGPCFGNDGYFRAVLVDCEPKVVDSVVQTCAQQHNIHIRPTNCVTGRSGRGNSWSLGYCGLPETDDSEVQAGAFRVSIGKDQLERDRTVLCRALKAIHTESRRCDDGGVEAIVVLHSMAGGTGSGLGCALIENIRHHFCSHGKIMDDEEDAGAGDRVDDFYNQQHDDTAAASFFMRGNNNNNNCKKTRFANNRAKKPPPSILPEEMIREGTYGEPRKARFVLSVCVAPLVQGELAVQSINASLTLRTVVKNCDAVILLRNDCQKMFASSSSRVTTSSKTSSSISSFDVINNFFASLLVSALQGGNSFGCISELLEASVFRVAGEEIDWENYQQQQNEADLEDGDENNHQQQQRKLSPLPKFGPRILTLIPWDPRAAWAAGFRHSSVTATLIRNTPAPNSSSSTTTPAVGQQHDPDLLKAYLCNEVQGLDEDLCTIIDRNGEILELLRKKQLLDQQQQRAKRLPAAAAAAMARQDQVPETGLSAEEKNLVQAANQLLVTGRNSSTTTTTTHEKPVLVLNQCAELCTSILFPFFKDAAAKVETGAYMHTYNTRGILSQVFDTLNTNNNNSKQKSARGAGSSAFGSGNSYGGKKFSSPRRSVASERKNTEFARNFVNNALRELLEYFTESFPGI